MAVGSFGKPVPIASSGRTIPRAEQRPPATASSRCDIAYVEPRCGGERVGRIALTRLRRLVHHATGGRSLHANGDLNLSAPGECAVKFHHSQAIRALIGGVGTPLWPMQPGFAHLRPESGI
jgi:hypothetical protein